METVISMDLMKEMAMVISMDLMMVI